MSGQPELLHGGVANAGTVVRIGDVVERPANPNSATIHRALRGLRTRGFEGASNPIAIDGGRERLEYVDGDVPIPPYPTWAQTDAALASVARLIRRMHDTSVGLESTDHDTWSSEMRDRSPGDRPVLCHNDVCMENVVFRDGEAVALLDFDFAAPGRRTFDLASFVRMCVPVDDDVNAPMLGWRPADRPARTRIVADSYGLDRTGRDELLRCLDEAIARGGEFVLRRVEAGETAFVEMWESMGGMERFDRRRAWWADTRERFVAALR